MIIPTLRQTDRCIEIWTIYDHPKDFPDSFVARRFLNSQPQTTPSDLIVSDTVEHIREMLARNGYLKIDRAESDDPCIVETWL